MSPGRVRGANATRNAPSLEGGLGDLNVFVADFDLASALRWDATVDIG